MDSRLRIATESDAAELAALYGHYVQTSPATFETEPPDEAEFRARISKVTAMFPWLVLEGAIGIEGYAYASFHKERAAYQWAVDVSAYVRMDCHRRGVGRRLYSALLEIARRQGSYTACAGITMPNDASVGLHKAMGFELVGVYQQVGYKFCKWHDTSWWQLSLRDREVDPKPPVSWRAVGDLEPLLIGG